MPSVQILTLAAFVCIVAAQNASSTSSTATSIQTGMVILPAEVENCHAHDTSIFCFAGEEEWEITSDNAAEYDGQSLSSCTAGNAENSLSCEATDGSDVVLVREEEENNDHAEESHSDDIATVPTEVEGCHSHEDGIYCFAGEDEWEITSENAANYEGQTLTACEAGSTGNSTISCNADDGSEITLVAHAHSEDEHSDDSTAEGETITDTQNTTITEETAQDGQGAGSTVMASVSFSVVGLVLAVFAL